MSPRLVYLTVVVLACLFGAVGAIAQRKSTDEVVVGGDPACRPDGRREVAARGELKLIDALTLVAGATCERFLVPRSLTSVRLDLGVHPQVSAQDLGEMVRQSLRKKGIALEPVTPTWRLRQTAER
jgi:hypothetical protein